MIVIGTSREAEKAVQEISEVHSLKPGTLEDVAYLSFKGHKPKQILEKTSIKTYDTVRKYQRVIREDLSPEEEKKLYQSIGVLRDLLDGESG